MKDKVIFIIPYFGNFNNYFQLFLNSCATNPDFSWLIITDNNDKYDFPRNVLVKRMSFSQLKEIINERLNANVSINDPYKLCDLRPMYGEIFHDFISKFDWWGYCDIDLIFGKLNHFLTDDLLNNYDKIGVLGHCTLMKNTKSVNSAFRLPLNGKYVYKNIISSSNNFSFDEEHNDSINNIMENNGFKILNQNVEANPYTKSSVFRLNHLNSDWTYSIEKPSKSVFIWENGILKRFVVVDGKLISKEYLYIHFQSRKMKNLVSNFNRYKIVPNQFEDLEVGKIDINNFPKYKYLNMHYFRLRFHNLLDKIKNYMTRSRIK